MINNKNNQNVIIYENDQGEIKLDVFLEDETVWLNQEHLSTLYNKSVKTISEHIQNIFKEGELNPEVVIRKFRNTTQHGAIKGKTQTKDVNYYNLDVIISIGYRVKSPQGTKFRIWATQRIREYIVKGFALNEDRFKTGMSMNYFDELQEKIREIRLSERFFYQKIKDIYKTSIDYDSKDEKTNKFFKIVQNKLIWAISRQTAAELVYNRINADKPLINMKSIDKKSSTKITKVDATISKNYLEENEIKLLGLIVEQYLAFAETMAQQKTPMHMIDWTNQLDSILKMNKRELLNHAGKISHEQMLSKVNDEYVKYKTKLSNLEYKEALKELEDDINAISKSSF